MRKFHRFFMLNVWTLRQRAMPQSVLYFQYSVAHQGILFSSPFCCFCDVRPACQMNDCVCLGADVACPQSASTWWGPSSLLLGGLQFPLQFTASRCCVSALWKWFLRNNMSECGGLTITLSEGRRPNRCNPLSPED